MSENQSIAKSAFDLLARGPQQAGLSMTLAGGRAGIMLPRADPSGLLLLARSAKMLRPAEARAQYDLRVFVDERDGKFHTRIERITGMAVLSTMLDPSDVVAHTKTDDLPEATDWLTGALDEHFSGVPLSVSRLSYRANRFAECKLDAARGKPQGRFTLWRTPDEQLANFAGGVVEKAMTWGPQHKAAESLSLWFYPTGGSGTVFVTITPEGDHLFHVNINDHVAWPWKDNALSKHVSSIADVQKAVAGYLSKAHGFQVHAWHVYFNHTVRQAESDLDWV